MVSILRYSKRKGAYALGVEMEVVVSEDGAGLDTSLSRQLFVGNAVDERKHQLAVTGSHDAGC